MNDVIGEFRNVQLFSELFVKDDTSSYVPRVYQLRHGDVVCVNAEGFENCFKMKIKDINLCNQHFDPNFICMEKIRRKKWWQFWKPKHVAVRLMYVERNMEELKNEKERTENDFECNN